MIARVETEEVSPVKNDSGDVRRVITEPVKTEENVVEREPIEGESVSAVGSATTPVVGIEDADRDLVMKSAEKAIKDAGREEEYLAKLEEIPERARQDPRRRILAASMILKEIGCVSRHAALKDPGTSEQIIGEIMDDRFENFMKAYTSGRGGGLYLSQVKEAVQHPGCSKEKIRAALIELLDEVSARRTSLISMVEQIGTVMMSSAHMIKAESKMRKERIATEDLWTVVPGLSNNFNDHIPNS